MEEAWASTSKVSSIQAVYPNHLKPTNVVREHRKKGNITGQYVIDTGGGTSDHTLAQPTVHLDAGDGNINAKIWLVGKEESNSSLSNYDRRPLFILECVNGFINLEIVR